MPGIFHVSVVIMPRLNECFVGSVRDLNGEGSGVIEHKNGQVFFVPGVWPGETGRFRVTGFKKRFGFAELVELLEPSEHRITPECKHHGFSPKHCRGCPWQFVDYKAQLAAKQRRVNNGLSRLGVAEVEPIAPSVEQWGYRNRAQLKSDGRQIGYVGAGSNTLAPVTDCPVLTAHTRATLGALLETLPNAQFKPLRKKQWTTLDIDEDVDAESVSVNCRRPFRQANTQQNGYMRQWLRGKLAGLDSGLGVMELFCGDGNFTEIVVQAGFHHIVAVEGVAESVELLNGRQFAGVEAIEADLFTDNGVVAVTRAAPGARVLILDPPRDGFRLVNLLLERLGEVEHIFYISCNLATFLRDLKEIQSAGFAVSEVQPLDQFPQTPHIELLAHLQRI